jgi:hypothetical protein
MYNWSTTTPAVTTSALQTAAVQPTQDTMLLTALRAVLLSTNVACFGLLLMALADHHSESEA